MNLYEISILEKIASVFQNPVMDNIMIFVSSLFNNGYLPILIAVILLFTKYKKTGVRILISITLAFIVCNLFLKPLVGRIRPYEIAGIPIIISKLNDYSFPSGHSHASFSFATSVFYSSKKQGIFLYVLSVLVCFSRLYLFVHYPTDVLAGAFIGFICAYITENFILKKIKI
jgi:undecaprenyl-diphosphatase